MTRIVKGKELVILEEDGMGGYISIEVDKLKELMPLIQADKDDLMGWKRYEKVLKEEKLDVEYN